MTRRVDPSTSTARAGLGRGGTGDGVDLIAPMSLASVRAYADLPSVDEAMEGRNAYRRYGGGNPQRLEEAMIELETVLTAIGDGHDTAEALAIAGLGAGDGLAALSSLELAGYLRRQPGGRFTVVP